MDFLSELSSLVNTFRRLLENEVVHEAKAFTISIGFEVQPFVVSIDSING